jgi:hypothetical protein
LATTRYRRTTHHLPESDTPSASYRVPAHPPGEVAVVVSIEEYRRLTDDLPSFKDLLLAAPDLEALDLRRSREPAHAGS